jgi:hypothetical protein
MEPDTAWVPPACTLPTADRPLRVAEFDDLFAARLVGVHRLAPRELRLVLTGGPETAERAADLAARESECCSFFDFQVRPEAGRVVVLVAVPDHQQEVLDALEARARDAVA